MFPNNSVCGTTTLVEPSFLSPLLQLPSLRADIRPIYGAKGVMVQELAGAANIEAELAEVNW